MNSKHTLGFDDPDIKKGNPIASNRFRWQTYIKVTDEPMESEWDATKEDAKIHAAKYLIKQFDKFKVDDMVVKIFNEMNYKEKPIIITLEDAYEIIKKAT